MKHIGFQPEKEPSDDDRKESEDNEIIPFERISNYCCGDLDRLGCGHTRPHDIAVLASNGPTPTYRKFV